MSEQTSREGTQFGPYRLLRMIGKGGMGEVYEAEDTRKDRIVALKLLPQSVSHDPVFRKRLQREAHSAGRLQEPHVVPIHDYGEIDGVLYVDMRMISGSDLRKLLKGYGPMTPARAVAIVRQVASALDAAHEEGIAHRDIKPENILVTKEDFAYLVDFGIANAKSDEKLTEMGTAVGTYAYMAPERFQSGEVTYRADIYSLACVLHECLTGSAPYGGDSVSVVITAHLMQPIPRPSIQRPGVPAAFDEVIARGMAKKPEERYTSAGAFAMAATQALSVVDKDAAETIVQRSDQARPSGPVGGQFHQDATMVAPTPPPFSTTPPPGSVPPPPPPPPPPYGPTPGSYPAATPGSYPAATPASYPAASVPPSQPYGFSAPPAPPPGPGGPGQSWPPPTGPSIPNSQGGKKFPWLPVLAIGGVLVLGAAAIGAVLAFTGGDDTNAQGNDTSTSTKSSTSTSTRMRPTDTSTEASPPPPSDDPNVTKLMGIIPSGYPTSVCEPTAPNAPGALAVIDCGLSVQPDGPKAARYYLFETRDQLQSFFDKALGEYTEIQRCPGATSDSPIDWNYRGTPDEVAGQVACGLYDGTPDIQWSQYDELVMADVQSDDMDALHNWWLNYS